MPEPLIGQCARCGETGAQCACDRACCVCQVCRTPCLKSGCACSFEREIPSDLGIAISVHAPKPERLNLLPISLKEANAFVAQNHRHSKPVVGHKFSLGAVLGEELAGVAIVGRPLARHLDDSLTLEVTRLATNGARNACSFLYGAAWRATRALGYVRLVTYTLASETGASLRAAGWRIVGEVKAESWHRAARPRLEGLPLLRKVRWEAPSV